MVAQLHRYHAVALHHRLGGFDRIGKERLEIRVCTRAVHKEADLQVAGGRGDCRRSIRLREIDGERSGLGGRSGFDVGGHLIEQGLPAG
jgi:hypothetical protein